MTVETLIEQHGQSRSGAASKTAGLPTSKPAASEPCAYSSTGANGFIAATGGSPFGRGGIRSQGLSAFPSVRPRFRPCNSVRAARLHSLTTAKLETFSARRCPNGSPTSPATRTREIVFFFLEPSQCWRDNLKAHARFTMPFITVVCSRGYSSFTPLIYRASVTMCHWTETADFRPSSPYAASKGRPTHDFSHTPAPLPRWSAWRAPSTDRPAHFTGPTPSQLRPSNRSHRSREAKSARYRRLECEAGITH